MIEQVIKQWDANKERLEQYFKTTAMSQYYSYDDIIREIIVDVLNHGDNGMNICEDFRVIDDGDYQGTRIYILRIDDYQPNVGEYIVTHTYYGSCSGCDTLRE